MTDDQASDRRPADWAAGAFSADGPWTIEPESMSWRRGIDAQRLGAAARVPDLIRSRRLPPRRGFTIVARLGWTVFKWSAKHRRQIRTPEAQGDLAVHLRPEFERLGPTFIKLGQLIASAEGMIPETWVDEFKLCRDRVPPETFAHVREVIATEFGRPVDEIFESIDPVPLAAASIAQVHVARLLTGEEVVVKVQRPSIDEMVSKDIATMAWLAPIIERLSPGASVANLPAYIELFADTIVEELDFRLEAENMLEVGRVLALTDQRSVIVPRPHPDLVRRRVLVMERMHGHSIDDEASLEEAGIDPSPVFRALMVSFLEGAVIHGAFHGDLHGGNMLIATDGRPVILDFGITGRFEEKKRNALLGVMATSNTQDGRGLLAHFRDLGGFPPGVDVDELADKLQIDSLLKQTAANAPAEQMALQIRETMKHLVANGAKLPKELFLFIKGMVYLTGATARVAKDVDMFVEIAHLADVFFQAHLDQLKSLGVAVEQLPDADEAIKRMKEQLGLDSDAEALTLKELQALRQARSDELRAALRKK